MPCTFMTRARARSLKRPTRAQIARFEQRVTMLRRFVPWPALVQSMQADLDMLRSRLST